MWKEWKNIDYRSDLWTTNNLGAETWQDLGIDGEQLISNRLKTYTLELIINFI
jgi:hypothetical protein